MKEFEVTLTAVSRKPFKLRADSQEDAFLMAEAILENTDLLAFSDEDVDSMDMTCEEQCGGVCDNAIVAVALSQVGNIGGQPYWSWYGFEGRVEWCACFVNWCANECVYINTGVIPKFADCVNGVQWFKDRGQWADNSIEPIPGMIFSLIGIPRMVLPVHRMGFPTMWVSWKNAKTALSILSRAIPAIAAGRDNILWAITKFLAMVYLHTKAEC